MTTRCGICKKIFSTTPLLHGGEIPPEEEWCQCKEPTKDFSAWAEMGREKHEERKRIKKLEEMK
jgi:hypothetical protein